LRFGEKASLRLNSDRRAFGYARLAKAMIARSTVIDVVARSPWTALVLSPEGEVADVVPFPSAPTAQSFQTFARTHARGRRFRFVQQARLDLNQLDALLVNMLSMPSVESRRRRTLDQVIEAWEPDSRTRRWRATIDEISTWIVQRFWW